MALKRTTALALALPCAAAAVLGTAAPGSAAAARSTTYAGSWTFDGDAITGSLNKYVQVTDYQGGYYFDRVAATPAASDALMSIDGASCPDGSYYKSGISLYGETEDWVQRASAGPVGGNLRIACTRADGVIHHFHWGSYVANTSPGPTSARNCVRISRSGGMITVTASADCLAQDRVVNNSGKVLRASTRTLPFTSRLDVPGLR